MRIENVAVRFGIVTFFFMKTINLIVPRGWHNEIGCGGINSVASVGDFSPETLGCEFQGIICCDVRAGSHSLHMADAVVFASLQTLVLCGSLVRGFRFAQPPVIPSLRFLVLTDAIHGKR